MKVTEDGVPVQDVIAAVKLAIKEANVSATDEGRDLRVGSVNLVLHALATRSVGGGLSFTVPFIGMPVRFGSKVTRSDTHEIEINLAPPAQEPGEEVREAALDLVLVDSIETIRAAWASTVPVTTRCRACPARPLRTALRKAIFDFVDKIAVSSPSPRSLPWSSQCLGGRSTSASRTRPWPRAGARREVREVEDADGEPDADGEAGG